MNITKISPQQVQQKLLQGALLVDIRTADERRREYIAQAQFHSLDAFGQGLNSKADCVIFHCQSGMRTQANAEALLREAGAVSEVYILEGGLNAWKKAGLPTELDKTQPLPLMRQVQIAAGSLVLVGVLLGYWVSPTWFLLSGFVGAGLVFAGISGFCGMALLLAKMPWNKL